LYTIHSDNEFMTQNNETFMISGQILTLKHGITGKLSE